jgi:hypothetical protein
MLKNISRLEHKIGERIYHFSCEMESPIPDVKESLVQFIKYIAQIEDQIKSHQEQMKLQEEQKQEEVKEEPKPAE